MISISSTNFCHFLLSSKIVIPTMKSYTNLLQMGSGNVKPESEQPVEAESPSQFGKAIDLLQSGELSESLMLMKKVVLVDPSQAAYQKMGELLNSIGLYREAREYFEKVLEENPLDTVVLRKLSMIYNYENDSQSSIKMLKKAISVNPDQIETMNLLIINECNGGSFKEAIATFKAAVKKIDENQISFKGSQSISDIVFANFYNNAGNAYRYAGNLKQALLCYEKAIQLNNENSLFYVNCALALSNQEVGNYKKAYEYLEIGEKLLLNEQSEYNSYVLEEVRGFKAHVSEWNFKKNHNYSTEEERESLSLRMKSLEKKISDLYEPDLEDSVFDYAFATEVDRKLQTICKVWKRTNFSLQGIKQIDAIIYSLYKENHQNFSILPLHLLIFCVKQLKENTNIKEVEEKVSQLVNNLAIKYPPSEQSPNKSAKDSQRIKSFELPKEIQPNMFSDTFFKSYENLMSEILVVSSKAKKVFSEFDPFLKDICLMKGHCYKSGLKFPEGIDDVIESKIMIRVAEKLFKELKDRKEELLEKVEEFCKKEEGVGMKMVTVGFLRNWKEIITQILKQRILKKEQTICRIYDFVRAKCMYQKEEDIQSTAQFLIKKCQERGYQIIECDNRLLKNTKDIVFKIKFGEVVGQIQLALEFDSTLNEFNHGLYEIKRSPGGCIFGAVLWLGKLATLGFMRDIRRIYEHVKNMPEENKERYEVKEGLAYVLKDFEKMK